MPIIVLSQTVEVNYATGVKNQSCSLILYLVLDLQGCLKTFTEFLILITHTVSKVSPVFIRLM